MPLTASATGEKSAISIRLLIRAMLMHVCVEHIVWLIVFDDVFVPEVKKNNNGI